jgi:hypothetical protein
MNKLVKILYGLAALALGVLLSVTLVRIAVSHDTAHEDSAEQSSLFPDYVKGLNEYYKSYENRRDHFHQTAERYFLPMDQQENCLTCHSLWPHQKDSRTRSFNNQHSRYMSCMVCHIDDQPGRAIGMEWYNFGVDNSITRQGPFGIERKASGELSGMDNFITKIVPVMIDGDISTRVYTPYNTPNYAQYRQEVDAGKTVDADEMRKVAEALVGDTALTCGSCHSEASQFPWEALRFAGDRLDEMTHSAVVGMVEKYESFYFPPVFE